MYNIAVFASHGGSDLQAIMDGCATGQINARVCVVISNNSGSMALERARRADIPAWHFSAKTHPEPGMLDKVVMDTLTAHQTDIIVLAGYMRKLSANVLQQYNGRIYNIHPALLPKFGGQGMYGLHVHAAVIAAGEKVTGVTIHHVNSKYDAGDIVAQTEVVVLADDTSESLAARVLKREHVFLVEVLQSICAG